MPALIVDCGGRDGEVTLQGGPQLVLCDEAPLAELDPEGSAAGFFATVPLGGLVELTRSPTTSDAAARAAEGFFASLGRHVEWVGDAPGLVLGRIVVPARQRGVLRARRGRRRRRGHRRRHGPRPQPPPRPARVGRRDRPRHASSASSPPSARSTARSATAPRPRCCARCGRAPRCAATRTDARRFGVGRRPRSVAAYSGPVLRRAPPRRRRSAPRSFPPARPPPPLRPTVTLPGDAAAASVRADRSTWLVGARPGRAADAVAAAHGGAPRRRGRLRRRAGPRALRSPARCVPAGCCSTPSPTGSPAGCRARRPTRSTPGPRGAPRSSTRAWSRRPSRRRARCSR